VHQEVVVQVEAMQVGGHVELAAQVDVVLKQATKVGAHQIETMKGKQVEVAGTRVGG